MIHAQQWTLYRTCYIYYICDINVVIKNACIQETARREFFFKYMKADEIMYDVKILCILSEQNL